LPADKLAAGEHRRYEITAFAQLGDDNHRDVQYDLTSVISFSRSITLVAVKFIAVAAFIAPRWYLTPFSKLRKPSFSRLARIPAAECSWQP